MAQPDPFAPLNAAELADPNFANPMIIWANDIQNILQTPLIIPAFIRKQTIFDIRNMGRASAMYWIAYCQGQTPLAQIDIESSKVVMAFCEFIIPMQAIIPGGLDAVGANGEVARILKRRLTDVPEGNPANARIKDRFSGLYRDVVGVEDPPRTQHELALAGHMGWATSATDPTPAECLLIIDRLVEMKFVDYRSLLVQFIMKAGIFLACRGQATQRKIEKISSGIMEGTNIRFDIELDTVPEAYSVMFRLIHELDLSIRMVLRGFAHVFNVNIAMRMYLAIQQGAFSGGAGITIITEALASYPNLDLWNFLIRNYPAEWNAYKTATAALSSDPVMGFRAREHTEVIKNKRFPTFLYAAKRLLEQLGNNKSIKAHKADTSVTIAFAIDRAIKHLKDNPDLIVNMDDSQWADGQNVLNAAPDLLNWRNIFS